MNASATSLEQLTHALVTPTRGILGLVEDLLAVAVEHGLQLDYRAGQCRLRFLKGGPSPPIEVPLRQSVIRAALARIAVLCNRRQPNSVSPYGGHGELLTGSDPAAVLRVAFVNTPDDQHLELLPLESEGAADAALRPSPDGNPNGPGEA